MIRPFAAVALALVLAACAHTDAAPSNGPAPTNSSTGYPCDPKVVAHGGSCD